MSQMALTSPARQKRHAHLSGAGRPVQAHNNILNANDSHVLFRLDLRRAMIARKQSAQNNHRKNEPPQKQKSAGVKSFV
ncbi:hypothetical protein [Achromobacter pulmonis]|uniref:hypothetical protein n=1 Tax=Achromobacter pulmonis TaxID=1389932 RepID=UPI0011B1E407|nr:hypothetical protein [Achromobacter pulmonis]